MKVKFLKRNRWWKWAVGAGVLMALGLAVVPVWREFKNVEVSNPVQNLQARIFDTPTPTPVEQEELSLEKILTWSREEIPSKILDLPQTEVTQVILGGDVMLGRAVNFNMYRKNDFSYPFAKIGDKLRQADIMAVNLEAPMVAGCEVTGEGMQLCSDSRSLETLDFAGVDLVQLANNHIWDYGRSGAEETRVLLDYQRIGYVGLGEAPWIRDVRGTKFGWLAFNQIPPYPDVILRADEELLAERVGDLRDKADVVIVGFHWGQEYQASPTEEQVRLARAAVDAGADVVWGHHPHWVQGMEVYEGKPIFYSLGNLVFDQMRSTETREGLLAELWFWKDALMEVKLLPVFMKDFAQPDWQAVGMGNVILGKIERYSEEINRNK